MTEVLFQDEFNELGIMEEVYKLPKQDSVTKISNGLEPYTIEDEMLKHEKQMVNHLEESGKKVLKVSSKLISKRRYKRRLAKLVKKNKLHVTVT